MLGTRALSQPGTELPIDLLFVGSGVPPPEVLAHQSNPGIEEIEREPERSGGGRRGSHARNCNAAALQRRRAFTRRAAAKSRAADKSDRVPVETSSATTSLLTIPFSGQVVLRRVA